ncbi:MAG: hypothetical protein ACRDNS_30655, partial [Trebonia sp.]
VELSPGDWTLYSAIGAAFDQKSDFTDASTAYERGLQIDPKAAPLLNNYAMSRMLAGDLPGAQRLIARAQAAGDDPKITHNAALMANLRGSNTAAQAAPARHVAIAEPEAPAKVAATSGRSEAEVIREAISELVRRSDRPRPRGGLFASDDASLSGQAEGALVGFGQR